MENYIITKLIRKNNQQYIREYIRKLPETPEKTIKYVIVKGEGNIVNKMRPPSTKEEIDVDWYENNRKL